jgi:hypothetical protein
VGPDIYNVTYRLGSRQGQKYEHATIEKVLQKVFSMWSVPCPLLGNGSPNTFLLKQTRGTIGHLLLDNGGVNRFYIQYRLCFPWCTCTVVIRESSSEAGSSVELRLHLWTVNQRTTEAEEPPLLRIVTRKYLVKTLQRKSHFWELLPSKD